MATMSAPPAHADEAIQSPNTTNANDVRLPLGWEERRTTDGRPYFVDHHTHDYVERPTVDLWLGFGGDQHGAREPRATGTTAIRLGNAHDVDAAHLLRQHAHCHL